MRTGFVADMKTPTSAAALRAARALLGVSIRELEPRVKLLRKAIAAVEAGTSTTLEHNIRLIHFYEAQGIEFLGQLSFGVEVKMAGARWKAPQTASSSPDKAFRSEKFRNSFAAARGLIGSKQSAVAKATRLPATTVSSIELGHVWQAPSETLRRYYVELGVEFLGHPDPTNPSLFYGVGVQWTAPEKAIDN